MYGIAKETWGYKLRFGGFIPKDEMERWRNESQQALAGVHGPFGVFVDMHDLKPLAHDVQEVMVSGQGLFKQAGMVRSAVLLDSAMTALQFKRLAKESGIYEWERYLSPGPDAEREAVAWVRDGVDPDA